MATFRCYTSPRESRKAIHRFVQERDIEILNGTEEKFEFKSKDTILKIELLNSEKNYLDLSVQTSLSLRGRLFLFILLIAAICYLYQAFVEIHYREHIINTARNLIFYVLPCLVLLAVLVIRCNGYAIRLVHDLIAKLKENSRVDQLTPLRKTSISRFIDTFGLLGLFFISIALFYSALGAPILLFLLPPIMVAVAELLWAEWNADSWKARFVTNFESGRQLACFLLIAWFIVVFGIGVMLHVKVTDKFPLYVMSYKQGIIGEWAQAAVGEYQVDPTGFRWSISSSDVLKDSLFNSVAYVQIGYMITLAAFGLFQCSARRSWHSSHSLGAHQELPSHYSAITMKRSAADNIALGITSMLRAVFYWECCLISLDIVAYLVNGTPVFFNSVGLALAALEISLERSPVLADSFLSGNVLILPMLGPGVFIAGSVMARSIPLAVGPLRELLNLSGRHELPSWVQEIQTTLDAICQEQGVVRVPQLRIISTKQPSIFIQGGFSGARRCVLVSGSCREVFSDKEIEALVLHEAHHIITDVNRIEVLRILSLFLLHPVNYLALTYDFGKREMAADAFAAEKLGDARPLISALLKLSIAQLEVLTVGTVQRLIRPFVAIMNRMSFIREPFIGASYPFLNERLDALRRYESEPRSQANESRI